MDVAALQASWSRVAAYGDAVPGFFYAALFSENPQLRGMFPASMAAQRDRLVGALGRIVSGVADLDAIVPFVEGLGRDHRRFDVEPEHFPAVGQALLMTLAQFLGDDWTPQLEKDWGDAFGLVADVMIKAADADTGPAHWTATVEYHDRRGLDVAVIRLRPDQPLPYVAGQAVALSVAARPRLWRYYSPANAPRQDGSIDLHVKAVPGGQMSTAVVHGLRPGDQVKLGAPVGHKLLLDPRSADLLLIGGGTGLAPLKALIEQVAAEQRHRRVTLFAGARTTTDLYDMNDLDAMVRQWPWLTVVPAVSDDRSWSGVQAGPVVDVAMRHGPWSGHDVYLCGSSAMVSAGIDALRAAGFDPSRVHSEDDTSEPYRPQAGPGEV